MNLETQIVQILQSVLKLKSWKKCFKTNINYIRNQIKSNHKEKVKQQQKNYKFFFICLAWPWLDLIPAPHIDRFIYAHSDMVGNIVLTNI